MKNLWFSCEIVMENTHHKPSTVGFNSESAEKKYFFVPNRIDLSQVEDYRASLDDDGNIEPFTTLYTRSDQRYCIKMSFEDFDKHFQNLLNL